MSTQSALVDRFNTLKQTNSSYSEYPGSLRFSGVSHVLMTRAGFAARATKYFRQRYEKKPLVPSRAGDNKLFLQCG